MYFPTFVNSEILRVRGKTPRASARSLALWSPRCATTPRATIMSRTKFVASVFARASLGATVPTMESVAPFAYRAIAAGSVRAMDVRARGSFVRASIALDHVSVRVFVFRFIRSPEWIVNRDVARACQRHAMALYRARWFARSLTRSFSSRLHRILGDDGELRLDRSGDEDAKPRC